MLPIFLAPSKPLGPLSAGFEAAEDSWVLGSHPCDVIPGQGSIVGLPSGAKGDGARDRAGDKPAACCKVPPGDGAELPVTD